MCGICGKFGFSPDHLPTLAELTAMCRMIVHRGPDSEGIKLEGPIGIGARRLRIIDLNTGDQPITNENGTIWAVLNGEIYNFRDLRTQLVEQGHHFTSGTDTEVLVHMYEEFGDEFIKYCYGMFAFCIYDVPRQRLVLARDRVGKKPLFYSHTDHFFAFGSELKCLLSIQGVSREVNRAGIMEFLTYGYVATPNTAFESLYQLAPGHALVVEHQRMREWCYWDPIEFFKAPTDRPLEDLTEEYLALLRTAIADRLISDVPVGLLLSGGIDSTSIAALLAEQNQHIPTFTVRFSEHDKDEGKIARLMADCIDSEHHELFVRADDLAEVLPRLVWHYEQPYGDSSAIPTYYVARMARQHVTVVLNGDGGDEAFGGYWRHLFNMRLYNLRWLPSITWKLTRELSETMLKTVGNQRLWRWLNWISRAAERDPFGAATYWLATRADTSQQVLTCAPDQMPCPTRLASTWAASQGAPYLSRVLYSCDLNFALLDDLMVKMDRAAMANSLEARSPFLDHRLIEFAAQLPPTMKVRGLTTKWLPKHAMRNYLPPSILNRPKSGFGIPIRQWMSSGPLSDRAWEIVLSDQAAKRGYFDMDALRKLRDASRRRTIDTSYFLYDLLFLELWHRTFIDEFLQAPAPHL